MTKILITGGTGLVGSRLSQHLLEKGYEVAFLSRNPGQKGKIKLYQWDIDKGYIDAAAFHNTHVIIHLAGAGLADHRWTEAYKKEILDSRVKSTRLLGEYLQKHNVPRVICASAVGLYGDRKEEWLSESTSAGTGFLADVCQQWEKEIAALQQENNSVAWVRIGIVLSTLGGALPAMSKTTAIGIGGILGNGQQFTPWIHIDDLCGIFIHLVENQNLKGPFNGSSPQPLSNKDFTKAIHKAMGKIFIPAPAPAFFLKMILGEQAQMILMSNRTKADKIIETGYQFKFTDAVLALQDLYQKKI